MIITGGPGDETLTGTAGDDIINGGGGADTMIGLAGNDFYYVDNAGDQVIEAAGGGTDNVYARVDYALAAGQAVENLRASVSSGLTLTGNELANTLIGASGNDTLEGGGGNDTLFGGLGADAMTGGSGNDVCYVDNAGDQVIEAAGGGTDNVYASVDYALAAGREVEILRVYGAAGLTLTGNALANTLIGASGSDTLEGGGGNDTLFGDLGADVMTGGSGNDIYYVDNAADQVIEAVGGGTDNVYASVSYTLAAGQEVEILRVYGSAGRALTGNALANSLIGGAGNDTLNGGLGADTMTGGSGNDIYYVDNAADQVIEAAGGGSDNVYASVSYTLAAGQEVEILRVYGSAGLTLTGNALANSLIGGAGNDTLTGGGGNDTIYGGLGADTMAGGSGNDIYYVDNAGDHVIEAAGGGSDNVYASVDYTLAAGQEVEVVRVYGSAGLTLTGNALANTLIGGIGNDALEGGDGNDTLYGGLGADAMTGGRGNDIYYVDNAADQVIEVAGGGSDNVHASVDYTLAAGQEVEVVRVYGSAGLILTGNELANSLIGASGSDTLNGDGGDDTLYGGLGADAMAGGSGNDVYYVDNAGDQVIEAVGGGSDNVYASVDYALAAGQEVEALRVYGSAALTLTGNDLANTLIGGAGNDTLNGGGGNDTLYGGLGADAMAGGSGNDLYYVDAAGDQVIEAAGGGSDTVHASVDYTLAAGQEVEALRVYGSAGLALTGNELANALFGASGGDTFDGGLGADAMAGGSGDDSYTVDDAGDQVIEAAGGGSDTVHASVDYTLAAGQEVEALVVSGDNGLHLTGNDFGMELVGSLGTDTLTGGAGNDTIRGGAQADDPFDPPPGDTLRGGAGDDHIFGGAGSDIIDGGAGADIMDTGSEYFGSLLDGTIMGIRSSDTIYVDNAGDQVVGSTWTSTIHVSTDWTATGNVSGATLRVVGSAGLHLTASGIKHTLIGGAGDDTLTASGYSIVLDGGAGADVMTGGAGRNTYYVDNVGDRIIDAPHGDGTGFSGDPPMSDILYTSVDYTVAAGQEIEHMYVRGTNGLHLTGNEFAMNLYGNVGNDTLTTGAGNDQLDGDAGADVMTGGSGRNTYYVDNAGDQVIEAAGGGSDTIYTAIDYVLAANLEVESLRVDSESGLHLTGNNFGVELAGGNGDDTLTGGTGNDRLDGGREGSDLLVGGAGVDTFVFGYGSHFQGIDDIQDFDASHETIELSQWVFTGFMAGALAANQFALNSPTGSNAQIVYDTASGALSFRPQNGDIAQFATIANHAGLSASNFVVV